MATPRLSLCKYSADIVFRDGTKRTIDYDSVTQTGLMLSFQQGEAGPTILVNIEALAVCELTTLAQPEGRA